MVELDQFKTIMNAYEEPLAEMRGFTLTLQEKSGESKNWNAR